MNEQDFAQIMAAAARTLRAQPDLQATLQSVVDLAATHLRGRAEVGISLVTGKKVHTPAATSPRAELADHLQYETGQGPCLDAIWEHETFQIEDLVLDQRYPLWSPRVVQQTGFRGIVSYQLFTNHSTLGALNVYTEDPHPYEAVDRAEGLMFATHAALAMRTANTEQQLNSGLLTRNLIGQAQGILMERYDLTADRAFHFLARVSQDGNIKLREVAERVVADRAQVPD